MGIMNKLEAIARAIGLPLPIRASHGAGDDHINRSIGKGKSTNWRQGKHHASQFQRASRRKAKRKA
ncbi:MAG: hypothetical protein R3Y11_08530 [Pseudomonadota bacterium]